jgi:two-component system sensor histidine kinase VanS
MSVRLKLTLSYAGFLMLAGALLLAAVWVFLLRYVPDRALLVNSDTDLHGVFPIRSELLHVFAPRAAAVLAFLLVFSLVGGWLLAGRMLAPLARITDATRMAATGSLAHRIQLPGRSDEFRELVDRLHTVNTRAIDLTEAVLLLSRADQRSFTRDAVDLSLIAEEATETLFPLAERRGVSIETSGDTAPTVGSRELLLQMSTNLVHNAIVHNLPEQGTVQITTSAHPKGVVLTVENTGQKLNPQLVATLDEPFQRGTERIRTDHAGVGLGLAIVNSIAQAHDGTLTLSPRAAGGLCVAVQLPAAPPHLADDRQGNNRTPREE